MKFLDHKQSGGVSQFQRAVRSRSNREDRPSNGSDDNRSKRVRLIGKVSPPTDTEPWRTIIDEITPDLPRVGKTEITSKDVIRRVQALVENKTVKSIVGGRALTRTTDQFVH